MARETNAVKVRMYLWDLCINLGLIANMIRIIVKDPAVLDLANSSHLVQTVRVHDIDVHLIIEMVWYGGSLILMMLNKSYEYSHAMAIHHVLTCSLLFLSYTYNLTYYAFPLLAILIITNPFMYFAKICHAIKHPAATPAFLMFALMFGIFRIGVFPLWYIRITLIDAYPYYQDHFPLYMLANGLLVMLLGLQVAWFKRIIHIILQSAKLSGQSVTTTTKHVS